MVEDHSAAAESEVARHRGGPTHRGKKPRAKLSPLTVIGELLFTCGLIVLGYFGWQQFHTEVQVVAEQQDLAADDAARWTVTPPEEAPEPARWDGDIPVLAEPAPAEVFGVLYVPAFGPEYANRMAETTDWWTVLNLDKKGIGHYETTQMPGAFGNFAVAGHRSGPLINSFREVMNLHVGDPLYVQTPQGWYTYRFRSIEYVLPTEVDVLNPFPRLEGKPGEDRIMTLTTCHPKQSGSAERAIAYAVFDDYRPLSEGPPPELAAVNSRVAEQSANPTKPQDNPVEHSALGVADEKVGL